MLKKLIAGVVLLVLSAVARADTIAFSVNGEVGSDGAHMPIYWMNSDGSNRNRLDAEVPMNVAVGNRLVAISPDGKKLAYSNSPDGLALDIYVMNVDGTNRQQITSGPDSDAQLSWSPDSTKIAFASDHLQGNSRRFDICVINADGSNLVRLPYSFDEGPAGTYKSFPAFNPDGTKIAFISDNFSQGGQDIYVINTDGTNAIRLTTTLVPKQGVAWCGSRILYSTTSPQYDIFSVAEDGSDLRQLTAAQGANFLASPSPDGSQVVFVSTRDGGQSELYKMAVDGSNQTRLTNTNLSEQDPTWGAGFSPVPTPTAGPTPTSTPVPTPTATSVPNAIPTVSFQLPQRGIRLNNGLPFEVRVEATDADGDGDIQQVSLIVQRSSDGFYWDGRSWGPNSTGLPLVRESSGVTYYKELNLGSRTQPDNYILTANAIDKAGAAGSAVTSLQLVDRIAPILAISQPSNLSRITSLPNISGTVYDLRNSESGYSFAQRVVVSLRRGSDGKYWTGSRWSDAYTLLATSLVKYGWKCAARLPQGSELTAGPLYITAIAYDAAGNRSTVTNGVLVQVTPPPTSGEDGLSIITSDSATGTIRLRYEAALTETSAVNPANYAVQLGAVRIPVEDIRYESGVVTLLLGADALPSGEAVTVTWRNLQRATGSGTFAGRTTVTVR